LDLQAEGSLSKLPHQKAHRWTCRLSIDQIVGDRFVDWEERKAHPIKAKSAQKKTIRSTEKHTECSDIHAAYAYGIQSILVNGLINVDLSDCELGREIVETAG
jgi:hypothetical protein